ncbi:MAG TPA: hypothetical protein VFF50_13080 [Candidatus Deferrimicrobiaceae bacterium]|jgi:FtsZ-interacting cell division protein ZipA|nr:hypothetical protein [Candidatus Deferrimicrobiaceae bacterium]
MHLWKNRVERAARNIVLLGSVFGLAVSVAAQQTAGAQLPDSPGATLAKSQPPAFPLSTAQSSQSSSLPPSPQDQPAPPPQTQAQPAPQNPVGTAAAEPTHAGGIAASQPAGVAIAPAKQRRTRTIVIRTAAIIGAAVAVGTVVGLTEATGSKPPGAH